MRLPERHRCLKPPAPSNIHRFKNGGFTMNVKELEHKARELRELLAFIEEAQE